MTIRKKDLETSSNDEIRLQIGKSTWTFRWTMLIGIFLATPFGTNLLKNLGVTTPNVTQTQEIQLALKSTQDDIKSIKDSNVELAKDVAGLKANNAIINEKVDTIQRTFTGFQVDFEKYKSKTP